MHLDGGGRAPRRSRGLSHPHPVTTLPIAAMAVRQKRTRSTTPPRTRAQPTTACHALRCTFRYRSNAAATACCTRWRQMVSGRDASTSSHKHLPSPPSTLYLYTSLSTCAYRPPQHASLPAATLTLLTCCNTYRWDAHSARPLPHHCYCPRTRYAPTTAPNAFGEPLPRCCHSPHCERKKNTPAPHHKSTH